MAFALGIGCVWFVSFYPRLEDKFTDGVVAIWNIERFRKVSVACGWESSSTEYVTLFGQRMRISYQRYPSPPLARQALEERVKDASRIIERKPVQVNGEVVGERVVAISSSRAAILWTKGKALYSIDAPSVGLATELERYEGGD